ncbi:MAG TPA: nicotinate-nucleotide adenylyltransferase [Vicinamibacterales bacterium]|nr:nicotinate-nucleotide adenylyltransferase [Vicinamibacterales bacterium]
MERLGVLGGTFDPVHVGHIAAAEAARLALALDRVLLMPSHTPPHRPQQPQASPFHRFAMAALAVQGLPGFAASDLELQAPGRTYTSETLERLAACGYRPLQIFFITGADAFAEIDSWRDYPAILDRGHFVVISRPGLPADALRRRLPALASRMRTASDELSNPSIVLVDAATPDVSSTTIRHRSASGLALNGLVPTLVADHITRHQLYSGRSVA